MFLIFKNVNGKEILETNNATNKVLFDLFSEIMLIMEQEKTIL